MFTSPFPQESNLSTDDARALGRQAFASGAIRVPKLEREQCTKANMAAWLAGWDAANLAAPIPGWDDEENARHQAAIALDPAELTIAAVSDVVAAEGCPWLIREDQTLFVVCGGWNVMIGPTTEPGDQGLAFVAVWCGDARNRKVQNPLNSAADAVALFRWLCSDGWTKPATAGSR